MDALIKLEPLLGTAIVINLAYLGIPEFAFHERVRHMIADRIKRLDPAVIAHFATSDWFPQLLNLTEVTSEKVPIIEWRWWISAPGLWGFLNNLFFMTRLGRTFAIAGAGFSLLLLALAVGNEVDAFTLSACHFAPGNLGKEFWLAVAAIGWPLLCVGVGKFVSWRAISMIHHHLHTFQSASEELAKTKVLEVTRRIDALNEG